MKEIIFVLLLGSVITAKAQIHSLDKIWETDTIIPIPESILPDFGNHILYVSLINGGGWVSDGIGGIGKLSIDGKHFDSTWITGLNAPKGLGRFGNNMYAADISEVVVIDIKKGKVIKKIPIEHANGLNDITVDSKGIVYVSDSRQSRIWRIEKDVPTLYLDSMKGVNGLKAIGENLYIAEGRHFIKADKNKNIKKIAEMPQSIDGVEPVGNGGFILTAWSGYIFYLTASRDIETLLDSHNEKMNTADLAFDKAKKILYVPTFNAKKVVAFQLR